MSIYLGNMEIEPINIEKIYFGNTKIYEKEVIIYTWQRYYADYNYVKSSGVSRSTSNGTWYCRRTATYPTWSARHVEDGQTPPTITWSNLESYKPTTRTYRSGTISGYYLFCNSDSFMMGTESEMNAKTSANYWSEGNVSWSTGLTKMTYSGTSYNLVLGSPNVIQGSYIDNVTSTDPSAYPDNGQQGNYWYVKIS